MPAVVGDEAFRAIGDPTRRAILDMLAQRDCSATRPCSGETGNKTLLILDGITQDIGALAVLTSFFIPEKKSRHWFIVGSDSLHAAPASVGSGYGMAAAGHF